MAFRIIVPSVSRREGRAGGVSGPELEFQIYCMANENLGVGCSHFLKYPTEQA